MFFRCSGLMEGELDCEEGARVGVELVEGGAMLDGSKSRSGSGGHIPGLRVILKIISRRMALIKRISNEQSASDVVGS